VALTPLARSARFALLAASLIVVGCSKSRSSDDGSAAPSPTATPPSSTSADGTGADRGDENADRSTGGAALGALPPAAAVANVDELVARLGLSTEHAAGAYGAGQTIAVLDNGFAGLDATLGRLLPLGTHVEPAPLAGEAATDHGTLTAIAAYAVATGSAWVRADRQGPRILLFNANGFTNFKAAVDGVIAAHADVVLYAQVWEYGGNGDGRGFIDHEVDRAVRAGVLWVNAAGNFAKTTYAGPLRRRDDDSVALPGADDRLHLTLGAGLPTDVTTLPLRVTLAWNDFDDAPTYRTPQDLDLFVENAAGDVVARSILRQSGPNDPEAAKTDGSETSAHAREVVRAELAPGDYRLRVAARSMNFDATSRLRISVDGPGAELTEATPDDAVLPPGDLAGVLTVGAADDAASGRSVDVAHGWTKPELLLESRLAFADGRSFTGTSAATAIAVGAAAALRSRYGPLSRDALVARLASANRARRAPDLCPAALSEACRVWPLVWQAP
jgi:hypothetical protein